MSSISQDFKKLVAKTSIDTVFDNDIISVSGTDLGNKYYYACYLIVNGKVVETCSYQRNTIFQFNIREYSFNDEICIRYYFQDTELKERTAKSIQLKELRKWEFFLKSEIVKFSMNKDFAKLGKNVIENFELKLGGFKEYNIKDKSDYWEDDPFQNRSWQWRLHWFEFVNHLLAYHCQSQNNEALDFIKKTVESWLDKYATKQSSFEFIWHDHATALRAEVLLVLYCYLNRYCQKWTSSNKPFIRRLIAFLAISKGKLEEESFYSKHTNHGLEQARVLLLLSILFDDNHTQRLAVARISSELQYSFTEEGVHKENSPGYHQFVLKVFLGIISFFPKNILGDLGNEFDEIGAKALEFIAHILRPDGNLPIIGDTELLPATDGYADYFKNNIEYQWYLYSSSGGKRGKKPKDTFKVYPKSGYAIYRNKWEDRNDFKNIVQLILKAGCLSHYHHQQDESNVVLYAYAEDWLIDSGLYNYIRADSIRQYMRKRVAHNIPIIEGVDYDHSDFSTRHNWSLFNDILISGRLSIVVKSQVLINTLHERTVDINDDFNIRISIRDNIFFTDQVKRNVQLRWHIPCDKNIVVTDNVVYIISNVSGKKLKITCSIKPENIFIHKGKNKNSVYSVYSKKMGAIENSQVLIMGFGSVSQLDLVSNFEFLSSK